MKELLREIPSPVLAVACLIVMAAYLVFAPGVGAGKAGVDLLRWQLFVMRWFHPLVWLLLAVSFFIRSVGDKAKSLSNGVALTALAVYVVFLITFILVRSRTTP